LKSKTLILALIISISFNIYLFNKINMDNTKERLSYDINAELRFLGGSLETLQNNNDLRFISSISGGIFWMARSSNEFDDDTKDLFQEINNFFISTDINKVYNNKIELSKLIKQLASMPNDKKIKTEVRNLLKILE
jgi:hypothetical protein